MGVGQGKLNGKITKLPNQQAMILDSPLSVQTARQTKFILNINNYRNTHYHTLNKAKINYKAIMAEQILKLPKMERVRITYILFPQTKRRTDIGNVLSIHAKFFEDALVEFKRLPDDDYKHIDEVTYRFGRVDKENPRVEIWMEAIE